jgi:hypothetical protein
MTLLAFALAWQFLPSNADPVVAMEWKRVLNSPLSVPLRREIPLAAAPVLAGLNFIEGIERVVWTPGLVVLHGTFDVPRLREMALADGGIVVAHRTVDVIGPMESEGTHIALVNTSLLLLGTGNAVKAALDRAQTGRAEEPSGFDLWVRSGKQDFGVQLGDRIRITSTVRYPSEHAARAAAENASTLDMSGAARGAEVSYSADVDPRDFGRRQWRTAIESLADARPVSREPRKPGVVRIYGLDEGVREVPLK